MNELVAFHLSPNTKLHSPSSTGGTRSAPVLIVTLIGPLQLVPYNDRTRTSSSGGASHGTPRLGTTPRETEWFLDGI